ncbi:hypothetical protein L195_g004243 [Trifolium pratense]|uniref:Uncharacterized protein n=1 Tax=Trifolium pratense TaxID=57577 RepID=A0A2K3NXH1_TRIPR|nr:hypothetical protein L195_g004243 [Trifolium pratense]
MWLIETKTPVAKRKNNGREAARISKVLSDLIAKRLASGGLKLGGGEIDTDDEVEGVSCCVVTEVEGLFSVSDMALMQILVLGSFVAENERGLWSENWERFRVPVPAIAITTLEKEQFDVVG